MGQFQGVEPSGPTLSGERLELRPWAPDDAGRVLEVLRDPAMREFLVLPDPFDADAARRWVDRRREPDDTRLDRAVIERTTRRLVGSAALREPVNPSVGYWIAPDARGNGYAAEAVQLLTGWAFGRDISRLQLSCDVRNLASIRTALASGFTFEGVSRSAFQGGDHDGLPPRYGDTARFARLAGDTGAPSVEGFPDLPDGVLSDGVLALRMMRPDDAPAFAETEDAETLRWSFDGVVSPPAVIARAAAHTGLLWLVGQEARLAMVDVATGSFAGELQVRRSGPPQTGSLGYVVHPRFRGRGYTARALRLVVPWAFEVAGLARLQLGAKAGNEASQRAAVSAGFAPDGVRARRLRNADGTFADELGFALVNPRYR